MPDTKNFGQRIEILDEILGGIRKHTLKQLFEKLNEKLEDAGYKSISKKTLFNDLKFLREEKEVPLNKPTKSNPYYYYTEKFTLKDLPLSDEEIDSLKQAAEILKRVAPFQVSSEIDQLIAKLENKIHTNVIDRGQIIQFESHTKAGGDQWRDKLFSAIREKVVLRIMYKPFHKEENELIFHPYLLKEYRNRWFLFGRIGETKYITNLALDRISGIKNSSQEFIENNLFNPETYFHHLVGVSLPLNGKIEEVVIKVFSQSVPYIRSKPIHHLQEVVQEYKNGDIKIKIPLYINFELKSILLSYGNGIEILGPSELRQLVKKEVDQLKSEYDN